MNDPCYFTFVCNAGLRCKVVSFVEASVAVAPLTLATGIFVKHVPSTSLDRDYL